VTLLPTTNAALIRGTSDGSAFDAQSFAARTVETNPPETSPHEANLHPTKSLPRWEHVHDVAAGAQALVESYRLHGYSPRVDQSARHGFPRFKLIAELNPRTYGLDFDDAVKYLVDFGAAARSVTLWELLGYLQATYCGSISIETAHVRSLEQRRWLYTQMETRIEAPAADDREPLRILARLAAAEAFDHFHRANCAHSKQFSLEGSESLVVLLRTTVEQAARHGVEDIVLGMPHRGRLNMMLNALDVPAKQMMSLFSGNPGAQPRCIRYQGPCRLFQADRNSARRHSRLARTQSVAPRKRVAGRLRHGALVAGSQD
jgi:2-oxoglutarate dehydrogenase complex dehydrogenase (E1) component-like enzyme